MPISMTIIRNHTEPDRVAKPSDMTIGKKMGVVTTKHRQPVMNMPSTTYVSRIKEQDPIGAETDRSHRLAEGRPATGVSARNGFKGHWRR